MFAVKINTNGFVVYAGSNQPMKRDLSKVNCFKTRAGAEKYIERAKAWVSKDSTVEVIEVQ